MDQKYWILIACWVLYFAVHSMAATTRMKGHFEQLGMSKTTYRKFYVIISTIGLLGLLIYSSNFSESLLLEPTTVTKYVSLVLAAIGTIVIRASFKQYSIREFLGLKYENPNADFENKGVLSYIRHPLYTGTILIILGYFLYIPKLSSLIVVSIVLLYLIIGIYLEEKKLEEEFGEKYREYKRRVPALFPKLRM